MSITFQEIKDRVVLLLGDTPSSTSIESDLLVDSVYAALDAIMPYVWKASTATIPGGSTTFATPSDLYEVNSIFDISGDYFIESALLVPETYRANVSEGNGWFQYPNGYISFLNAVGTDGATLYYGASWTKPTSDGETLEIPDVAINAIAYYAASYAILGQASSASKLGNYRTRMDSGNPEDNPLLELSIYFIKRFEVEVSRLPKVGRGSR